MRTTNHNRQLYCPARWTKYSMGTCWCTCHSVSQLQVRTRRKFDSWLVFAQCVVGLLSHLMHVVFPSMNTEATSAHGDWNLPTQGQVLWISRQISQQKPILSSPSQIIILMQYLEGAHTTVAQAIVSQSIAVGNNQVRRNNPTTTCVHLIRIYHLACQLKHAVRSLRTNWV